ncbi:MAG: HAD family phosphatase [Candidatus Woesearchaeota archaeon]|nr:HAD family phosphatase [Candidatus Woesearchaeota archaeon]
MANKNSNKKLICFDLDGTIIDKTNNIWISICEGLGADKERKQVGSKKFFSKLITYDQWIEHDVMLWKEKGVTRQRIIDIIKNLKLMEGTEETLNELKKKGFKIGVISDSLDIVLEVLLPNYKEIFDDVFINKLFFNEKGEIIGWKATKYAMEMKGNGLKRIAEKEGISLADCIFVGDGSNDINAARLAGFSIAFNSDCEELKRVCNVVIEKKDLREILRYV